MGNVLSAGLKQGPARQAMRKAGLSDATGATTINKLCGSGMKATMMAHDAIKAGSVDVAISGGMESMSQAPYVLLGARTGYRMGDGDTLKDHMFLDGLQDAETGSLMGAFAQKMADKKGYTREQMDAYATDSRIRTSADEPSDMDDALAAVMVPSFANAGRRPGIFSMLALNGCSSLSTTVSPLRLFTVTGTISALFRPFSMDVPRRSAGCRNRQPDGCLRTENGR